MLRYWSRKREKAAGNMSQKNQRRNFKIGKISSRKISLQWARFAEPTVLVKRKGPKKHGPYYQLSYSVKGKSRTRFIQPKDVDKGQNT